MNLQKKVRIYENSLEECFENGYNDEIIGIFKPNKKSLEYIKPYLQKGYRFIYYSPEGKSIDTTIVKYEDFSKFYKRADLFLIGSRRYYHLLFDEIMKISEKIIII